jgi:hypothetical protein
VRANQRVFVVITLGTANAQQDSGWLGLPAGSAYKEIFNSSWPAFAVESEAERTNGGYDARITSGQILNCPSSAQWCCNGLEPESAAAMRCRISSAQAASTAAGFPRLCHITSARRRTRSAPAQRFLRQEVTQN